MSNYCTEFGYLIHLFSVSSRLTSLIPRNTRTSHGVNWNPSMWRIQPLPHAWSCLVKTIVHPKMIVIIYLASCCSFFFSTAALKSHDAKWLLSLSCKDIVWQVTWSTLWCFLSCKWFPCFTEEKNKTYVFGMTWWWNTFLSAHSTKVLHVQYTSSNIISCIFDCFYSVVQISWCHSRWLNEQVCYFLFLRPNKAFKRWNVKITPRLCYDKSL